jgi:adenylate kinase
MKLDTIFFIGPQGSGKGTQAKILASKLGFFYWEMGGILREVGKTDTELGKKVKELLDRGVLLQDDLLLQVVESKLESLPKDQGLIFDGIPRRVGQAEFLLNHLKEMGKTNFVTVFIDLPKEESLSRLLSRSQKEGRADDTKEAIEFRLEQYEKNTLPVLDYLKKAGEFITIDGRPSVEEVTAAINKSLGI